MRNISLGFSPLFRRFSVLLNTAKALCIPNRPPHLSPQTSIVSELQHIRTFVDSRTGIRDNYQK